jgi:hypothetical protein
MKILTEKAIELIKSDQRIKGQLITLFNKSEMTINRWLSRNDVRLTTPSAIQIICQGTGISEEEIFETEMLTY